MQLTDLLPLKQWEAFENDLRTRSAMSVSVFDAQGIRITSNPFWVNKLCPAIKADPKGQSFICATAHMNIANMARQTGTSVIEECDAGLAKIVVPIVAGDLFLGSVGACGLILGEGEVDTFLINKITDLPMERLAELARHIGVIHPENAQGLCAYIEDKVKQLVSAK